MEFVDFNLAKKLKEKGFNLHCRSVYALENFTAECVDSCGDCYEVDFEKDILYLNYPLRYKTFEEKMLPAPTISQVLKWLREEKKIHLIVEISDSGWYYTLYPNVRWENDKLKSDKYIMSFKHKASYEQAALAGIEYVLDNLI